MPDDVTLSLRPDAVAWREFDGEGIVLDLRTSTYLSANAAATVLWRLLERGTTRDQLTHELAEAYGLDEERAEADVDAFLASCRQRGFIVENA
jgi:hypothetical protein